MELISATLITIFLLKYNYYIHHLISIVIFCILSIIIDLLLKNFLLIEYKYIYVDIIYIADDIIFFCYIKYMMYNLYYQYWYIVFIDRMSDFITLVSFTIIGAIINSIKGVDGIIYNFISYFTKTNIYWITLELIFFILYGAFLHVLSVLTVNYLTPNHVVVCNEIIGMGKIIIKSDNSNKWISLLLFILMIISSMFYLEILECNFCGLNENTKNNIINRANIDINNIYEEGDEDNNNEIINPLADPSVELGHNTDDNSDSVDQ